MQDNDYRAVTPLSTADVANAIRLATMLCLYWDRQRKQRTPVRKESNGHIDYHCTLQEVGRGLGVTGEAARQLQEKALNKLRHRHRIQYMRDYL